MTGQLRALMRGAVISVAASVSPSNIGRQKVLVPLSPLKGIRKRVVERRRPVLPPRNRGVVSTGLALPAAIHPHWIAAGTALSPPEF